MNDLITWINGEIKKKGWSNNELARRAGMSSSGMSRVLTGENKITWEFCYQVAQALKEPPEKLFRLAGLLPPAPPERDQLIQEITDILKQLTQAERKDLLEYARFRYQRGKEG